LFGLATCAQADAAQDVVVSTWRVSSPYPADRVPRQAYPNFYAIFLGSWEEVEADSTGYVELGARVTEGNPNGDLFLARHIFEADEDGTQELGIEFTEELVLFFNGILVSPDPPGAVAAAEEEVRVEPADGAPQVESFSVDVRKGLNEIFLMVAGATDEWGFTVYTDEDLTPKTLAHEGTEEVWITPDTFLTPESLVRDPERDVLYLSNFDNQFATKPVPSGYLSILSLQGEILEHRWVVGLHAPTGLDIWNDTLFVAERRHLAAVDLGTGEIVERWPIPDPIFPNDLVIDDSGTIYISDTRSDDWADSRIYRFREGAFDVFANEGISRANGLWIEGGDLLVGSSGDGVLKRVSLATGEVRDFVSLGAGIIDGIRTDTNGDLLVSHWEGQVYRVTPDGTVTEILDAMPARWNTADFEYLPESRLLVVPTFLDNRVRAVRIGGG
jgi:sugar lactone lactonase YvrE